MIVLFIFGSLCLRLLLGCHDFLECILRRSAILFKDWIVFLPTFKSVRKPETRDLFYSSCLQLVRASLVESPGSELCRCKHGCALDCALIRVDFLVELLAKEFLELYTQSIFVFNFRSNSVPNLYLDKLEGNLEIK